MRDVHFWRFFMLCKHGSTHSIDNLEKSMIVALSTEGFATSVITKIIGCHQSTFARVIKLKFEAGNVKRIA